MFNRIIILAVLAFSSAAIPMQSDSNYKQTRTIQSVSIENCIKDNDKTLKLKDALSTPVIESCNN